MSLTMAVIRRAILLSTVVLLTMFLEVAIGQDIAIATLTDEDCDCKLYEDPGCPVDPCASITCQNINTASEVQCAQQLLNKSLSSVPGETLDIDIANSDTDIFPDDFFAYYNVVKLSFSYCNLIEIPMRLINPACETITYLSFEGNELSHIPEGIFSNCTGLETLFLYENNIEELSPKVFYGLNKLSSIHLEQNRLTSFNGLEGITQLASISLFDNSINYVDKNAFQNLRKLEYIYFQRNNLTTLEEGTFDPLENPYVYIDLNGNPLYCNCSLKWLQDYCFKDPLADAYCGPDQIHTLEIDMSKCPSSPGRATRSSMTDLAVSIYLIMFGFTYCRII